MGILRLLTNWYYFIPVKHRLIILCFWFEEGNLIHVSILYGLFPIYRLKNIIILSNICVCILEFFHNIIKCYYYFQVFLRCSWNTNVLYDFHTWWKTKYKHMLFVRAKTHLDFIVMTIPCTWCTIPFVYFYTFPYDHCREINCLQICHMPNEPITIDEWKTFIL